MTQRSQDKVDTVALPYDRKGLVPDKELSSSPVVTAPHPQ